MDGKVFPLDKMQVGATTPSFHPWCSGTTAPYYEDLAGVGERFARNIETGEAYEVSAETIYEQWIEFVEKNKKQTWGKYKKALNLKTIGKARQIFLSRHL